MVSANNYRSAVKLEFHGSIFLVESWRGCPQQVVRVGLVEFGERHDKRAAYIVGRP